MSKAALVTGGAVRIGRAIALKLAEIGYDIAIHYGSSADAAEQLAGTIRAMGGRAETFRADLANTGESREMLTRAIETMGRMDVLVNNASLFERVNLAQTDEAFFDRTWTVNYKTPLFLTRDFAERYDGTDGDAGNVINLLDTKITDELTPYFVYSQTKKALADFTRLAAKELAPRVRVNGVAPGLILPPPGEDESYLQKLTHRVPLKTHGDPEDIAGAVRFLIQSDFITGQVIYVDGGEHLH